MRIQILGCLLYTEVFQTGTHSGANIFLESHLASLDMQRLNQAVVLFRKVYPDASDEAGPRRSRLHGREGHG